MKIKSLLIALCAVWCSIASYGQEFEGFPRKGMPKDELTQVHTRAAGGYVMKGYVMKEFPTTGEIKAAVILAEFSDVRFSIPHDSLKTLLSKRYNADDYTEKVSFKEHSVVYERDLSLNVSIPGSARDYFRDQSFGQFIPSFDIIGPVTLDNPRAYYGGNNSSGNDKNTLGMIKDACTKAVEKVDFKDYDCNNDGKVDIVYVVYAGCDEAQTVADEALIKVPDAIWAKASSTSFTVEAIGVEVARYACSGELVIDLPEVAGIGTFVHEFSHVLGLPDFYNTSLKGDEVDFTMDYWSVMDYGMYNAEGFVPCGYTAFERYSLGWIPMYTLENPETMEIGTTNEEEMGYRIFTSDADTTSFYLLETIRREGWNRYAPNNGLLISEVTYDSTAWRYNRVNVGTHRHCVVPANNDYNYLTPANKHLFGTVNHEFTLSSTPASITQFGVSMDKPLTEINYHAETGKTSFLFCGGNITDGVDGCVDYSDIIIQHSELIYDLQGRIVENPSKGIYIRDGKKVVIK